MLKKQGTGYNIELNLSILELLEKILKSCKQNIGDSAVQNIDYIIEVVIENISKDEKCKSKCLDIMTELMDSYKYL